MTENAAALAAEALPLLRAELRRSVLRQGGEIIGVKDAAFVMRLAELGAKITTSVGALGILAGQALEGEMPVRVQLPDYEREEIEAEAEVVELADQVRSGRKSGA